jgi:amino acid transporter, AAT family
MSRERELTRSLKTRHILMMALGGAIGAGVFQGSATSIHQAGPGVIFAYLLGGIVLLFVMQGLGQMTVNNPDAKTFRDLIQRILGPLAGHFAGWMYFLDWVLVMAAETAASAMFLQYWFSSVPLWLLSLIVSIAITVVNLFQVRVYGETEYWLAGIKITALVLFVVFGALLLITGIGHTHVVAVANLTNHGGIFPHGISGFAASMLVVMFSFGGTEMVGMTMGEIENPEKVIPRAARAVIVRILLFYILPVMIILSLVPWNQLTASQSPFVSVFSGIGIPYAGAVMNFVMLTAVMSATNTGMYAASRMLYTQARLGQAPRFFARLSSRGVPVRALLLSTSFLYIGVIIAFFVKGEAFNDLMVIPGYSVILVWLLISISHIRQMVTLGKRSVSLYCSVFVLLALGSILVGIVITSPKIGTYAAFAVILVIVLSYFAARKKQEPVGTLSTES